jgi:hypothetical protein
MQPGWVKVSTPKLCLQYTIPISTIKGVVSPNNVLIQVVSWFFRIEKDQQLDKKISLHQLKGLE